MAEGAVDALFYSRDPHSATVKRGGIRRLFPDPAGAALSYFRANGWFPIMHVLALKQKVADVYHALPAAHIRWYGDALEVCHKAYDDPAWSVLPFGRLAYESTFVEFGRDPWTQGFAANRSYLARFIDYARDQKLITGSLAPEDLFHPSVVST